MALKRFFQRIGHYLNDRLSETDGGIRIIVFNEDKIEGETLDVPILYDWLIKNGWEPGDPLEIKRNFNSISINIAKKHRNLQQEVRETLIDPDGKNNDGWANIVTVDQSKE